MNKDKEKKAKYISVAELARMLGISRIAVFKKIKNGKIPAEKIGRSYVISMDFVRTIIPDRNKILEEKEKKIIEKTVKKVVKEYGETLKQLGKE